MQQNNYDLQHRVELLHDYDEVGDPDAINALVASGDCFITLATRLDDIVHAAGADSAEQEALEDVVRTLIYLQRHFAITKKQPNYRQ